MRCVGLPTAGLPRHFSRVALALHSASPVLWRNKTSAGCEWQRQQGSKERGPSSSKQESAQVHRHQHSGKAAAARLPTASRQVGGCPRVDKQHGAQARNEGEQHKQVAGVGAAASPPPDAPPHLLHRRAERVAAIACVPAAGKGGNECNSP